MSTGISPASADGSSLVIFSSGRRSNAGKPIGTSAGGNLFAAVYAIDRLGVFAATRTGADS